MIHQYQYQHRPHHNSLNLWNQSKHRCLRIKRKKQIFFIQTSPAAKINSVKSEISEALLLTNNDARVIPENMKLFLPNDDGANTNVPGTELLDISSIADHEGIDNNSVLYLVLRDADKGVNQWESIDVFDMDQEEEDEGDIE